MLCPRSHSTEKALERISDPPGMAQPSSPLPTLSVVLCQKASTPTDCNGWEGRGRGCKMMRMTSLGPESQGQDEGSTCLVWGHIHSPSGPRSAPGERGWSQHHHRTTQTLSKEVPDRTPAPPPPPLLQIPLRLQEDPLTMVSAEPDPAPGRGKATPGLWWIQSHRIPGPVWSDPWGQASRGPHLALGLLGRNKQFLSSGTKDGARSRKGVGGCVSREMALPGPLGREGGGGWDNSVLCSPR